MAEDFVASTHLTLSSTATNELAVNCNLVYPVVSGGNYVYPYAQQPTKPTNVTDCLYGSSPLPYSQIDAGSIMSTYSIPNGVNGEWSGASLVDCSQNDAQGNNCCSPNIATTFSFGVKDGRGFNNWNGLCKHFLGAFMSVNNVSYNLLPNDRAPPATPKNMIPLTATPAGCCAYAEAYANSQACSALDNASGLLNVLTNSDNIQVCAWSGTFGTIYAIDPRQNNLLSGLPQQEFTQQCRPLTLEEKFIIAGDYKGGCYDWSARRQDTLANATQLVCPRYGSGVGVSSYTSPMNRFNSKTTFPYQPLDAECCAGVGTDCPATACFESPYCIDLLYTQCLAELQNGPPSVVCEAWQEFGRGVTSGNPNGRYNVTADVATRVSLDYCRVNNFAPQECDGLGALEGFLYDRLTPYLAVNDVQVISTLTTVVQVQNSSGRSVTNVVVNVVPAKGTVTEINVSPATVSFDPWGLQYLTLTYDVTNALYTTYSYSTTQNVVFAGINLNPWEECSISESSQINTPRSIQPSDYPLVNQCEDGDLTLSEASSTSMYGAFPTVPYNSADCTEAYTKFSGCLNCIVSTTPPAISIMNCDGTPYGSAFQPPYSVCQGDSADIGCPFCFLPTDPTSTKTNFYIAPRSTIFSRPNPVDPYRGGPPNNPNGCGCQGADGNWYEMKCGRQGTRRGLCSPQILYGYSLGFTRTCAGIDAQITVLLSTRTDLEALDFPVMGGFVAQYQPTGLTMDRTTFQVAVYPMTSFS